jgi:hypothetical protein
MSDWETRFERLELKYLIDEQKAREVYAAVAPYCVSDTHNPSEVGTGYTIYSLYLDTPSKWFYRAKMQDEPDRIKLRCRAYTSDGPVHLEVKRKRVDVIQKTRATVAREHFMRAACGLERPLRDTPSQRSLLTRFAYLMTLTGATPTLLVRYEREAFVSTVDHYARVTFDRRVVAQQVSEWDLLGDPTAWCSLAGQWLSQGFHSPVLLELKCETLMPRWMSAVIQRFGLRVQGFSKYCRGIDVTDGCLRGCNPSPGPLGAFT